MRGEPLTWYRLRWPRQVTAEQVENALRLIAGAAGSPVVIEAVGEAGTVTHRVALPSGRAAAVAHQLRAQIPGLACSVDHDRRAEMTRSVELRLSTKRRPLRTDDPAAVSRSLILALGHVGREERLGLQWVLARPAVPVAVPSRLELTSHESWIGALLSAPFEGTKPADAETLSALRSKQSQAGWRAVGRVAARAGSAGRERQLIRGVLGALRTAEGPSAGFRVRSGNPRAYGRAGRGLRTPLTVNVSEFAGLAAWPIGETGELPVRMIPARMLAPSRAVPRSGRVLATASLPGQERPVALTPEDARRSLHVIGPTGTGKSTLLLRLACSDVQAGRAVMVIEPKGDLIADILARVPADRLDDVVLIDPTDPRSAVGLNPLAPAGRSPELVADQLLGLFHALYADHWGPRTQDILGASLLTLARIPE